MFQKRAAVLLVALTFTAAPSIHAIGTVEGRAGVSCIKGQPHLGLIELYEWDAWLSPDGVGENHVRRVGAMPGENITHDGRFSFHVPSERYSLLVHQPEWWVRPKIVPDLQIEDGVHTTLTVEPPTDYSVGFGNNMGPWQGKGDPWDWAVTWHQTFVALGTGITKVQFKFAGTQATRIVVSIHKVVADASVETWPRIGPERVIPEAGVAGDNWTGWLSGEVPTEPGQQYAVRLHEAGGENPMGLFVHRDAVSSGYEGGTAYRDGVPQPYDLYLTVSSDSDGTLVAYGKRTASKPHGFTEWGRTWGQSWRAVGKSLAAMDLFAASGSSDGTANITAWVRVREGSPTGPQVGPEKKAHTAWWGPGVGLFGVSYSPGEVPLQTGKTYYMEVEATYPTALGVEHPGFNPMAFHLPDDAYLHGQAYRDGQAVEGTDLEMTIVEWDTSPQRPASTATPVPGDPSRNLLENGSMELGRQGTEGDPLPAGWSGWSTRKTAYWFGDEYGRDGTRGSRVIGGSINGTRIRGGLVQRVDGLNPAARYRVCGWAKASHLTSHRHAAALGFDCTGQTENPDAPTVHWLEWGRTTGAFELVCSPGIKPETAAISVWTRGENEDIGEVFSVDFDDLSLVVVE